MIRAPSRIAELSLPDNELMTRLKTAEERIRIWERIHEVTLPRDPTHRLVDIIASNTGLSDADVRDEQQRRATLRAAV